MKRQTVFSAVCVDQSEDIFEAQVHRNLTGAKAAMQKYFCVTGEGQDVDAIEWLQTSGTTWAGTIVVDDGERTIFTITKTSLKG